MARTRPEIQLSKAQATGTNAGSFPGLLSLTHVQCSKGNADGFGQELSVFTRDEK